MSPDKSLKNLSQKFILKRFKEKRFAKGADRNQIKSIEIHFDITYDRFINIILEGMLEYGKELGF